MSIPSAKFWIIGFTILVTAAGILVYTKGKNILPTSISPAASVPAGVTKAQELNKTYPKLVKTSISESIEGTLKSFTDKSWTVVKEGQSLTVNQESNNKIRYIILPRTFATSSAQPRYGEVEFNELKVGDTISINRSINWETGAVIITGITILR